MSIHEREEHDVYVIPPNFIEGGKLFGGMFKMRNAIEAGILAGGCALLVFKLPLSLTGKIIVLCLVNVQNLRCSVRFFEHIILTHFSIQIVYKLFLTLCIIKLEYLRKARLT